MNENSDLQPSRARIIKLDSKLLGKKISYYAIFPASYKKTDQRFGVLYLLHGLFGQFDNWVMNTQIVEYAKNLPFLIICPEGGDNWYCDNEKLPRYFYESYIFEELIEDVEKSFSVNKKRESRAIAGLSMGGYGAFKFAFRRPEMFCFAASMSGAFHAASMASDQSNLDWLEIYPSISQTFGRGNRKFCQTNDLFRIAETFPPEKINQLPFFHLDCGAEDSFLPINQKFAEVLTRRQIAHQFNAAAGGHDWAYWDQRIKSILPRITSAFQN